MPIMPQGQEGSPSVIQSPGQLNWGLGVASSKNLGIQNQAPTGGQAVGLESAGLPQGRSYQPMGIWVNIHGTRFLFFFIHLY